MSREREKNREMKKIVGTLVLFLIALFVLLLIINLREDGSTKVEVVEPIDNNETYQFQDVESMKKASSVKEAFERIFGKDRLFDDFENNESYNGDLKYYLQGVYKTDGISRDDLFKYNPGEKYLFETIYVNISMKPGFDTRMEMIDFLHYLQFSGLTKPDFIKEELPEDSVEIEFVSPTTPEEISPFVISMSVFQQIKPGMNVPESHQKWSITSKVIEVMDFSDKEDILNNINSYGTFEGVNPSGMNN